MSQLLVAGAMWLMFAVTLSRRIAERRSWIPVLTAVSIAISQTLNIDPISLSVDRLLGGVALSNLVMMSAFVVGIYLLGENLKAATGGRAFTRGSWLLLAVVLCIQTGSFLCIQGRSSAFGFMDTYGAQVPTLIYSQSHFLFFGITLGAVGLACIRSGVLAIRGPERAGFIVLLIASIVACVETAVIIVRDLSSVLHADALRDSADTLYSALLPIVAILIASGLSIPPIASVIARHRTSMPEDRLHSELCALRARLIEYVPTEHRPPWLGSDNLRRLVIEIQDMLFTTRISPTAREQRLLDLAEQRILTGYKALNGRRITS